MRTWTGRAAALLVVVWLGGGAAVASAVEGEWTDSCADVIDTPDGEAVLIGTEEFEQSFWVPWWWYPIELTEFEAVTEIGYYRLNGETIVIDCDVTYRVVE